MSIFSQRSNNSNSDSSENSEIINDKRSTKISPDYGIPVPEIYFPDQKPNAENHYYCVCFVDMIDSTKITARFIHPDKIGIYYSIFLNAMAAVAKNFGAKVIKNIGDGLMFYFPASSDADNKTIFEEILECFTAIIAARELINARLSLEQLPEVNYRLSADYGRVEVGTAIRSGAEDLFGPTVNICAKINPLAQKNGIIIGGDLYELIKKFSFESKYELKGTGGYSLGLKQYYPLYSLSRKETVKTLHGNYAPSKIAKPPTMPKGLLEVHPSETSPTSKAKGTVMIVDDEPDVLSVFKLFLLEEDYAVEAFSDSYTALQEFAKSEPGHFDLIILDIRMPSMNGLQLYQRLRAMHPRIKIIFLTALEASEELVSVLDGLRSVDVIKKPIDRKRFLQKVAASIVEWSNARDAESA